MQSYFIVQTPQLRYTQGRKNCCKLSCFKFLVDIATNSNEVHVHINLFSLPPPPKDAVPLYEQLQYNPMFGGAVELIFGGILLCRDMDKASQMSKSARMDCITLEGGHYIEVLD